MTQKKFSPLQADIEPIFREIEQVKEKHGLTTLSLESFQLSDQYSGSCAGKDGFLARREFKHRRDSTTSFRLLI